MRSRAEDEGQLIPSNHPLYGYDWTSPEHGAKTGYKINPETAWVVRRVYREAAEGKSIRAIALGLTDDGIPTPRRMAVWHTPVVRHLILHPGYKGEAWAFRTTHVENPENGKTRKLRRPEEEWVRLPDGVIPALVDSDLWDRANRRLSRNRAEHNRPDYQATDALLRAGFIHCGHCGHRMVIGRSGGKVWYRCQTGYRDKTAFRAHSILAGELDERVWTNVYNVVTKPERLRVEWERQRGATTPASEVLGIESSLAGVERQRANISRAIAEMGEGDDLGPLLAKLRELSAEAKSLVALRDRATGDRTTEEAERLAVEGVVEGLTRLAAEVGEWDYRRKRDALADLNIRVSVFPRWHEEPYRWVMIGQPPSHDGQRWLMLDSGPKAQTGSGTGADCGPNTHATSVSTSATSRSWARHTSPGSGPRGARAAPPSTSVTTTA